jgi:hypothetical protein
MTFRVAITIFTARRNQKGGHRRPSPRQSMAIPYLYSWFRARPITRRLTSLVPAPISYSLASLKECKNPQCNSRHCCVTIFYTNILTNYWGNKPVVYISFRKQFFHGPRKSRALANRRFPPPGFGISSLRRVRFYPLQ